MFPVFLEPYRSLLERQEGERVFESPHLPQVARLPQLRGDVMNSPSIFSLGMPVAFQLPHLPQVARRISVQDVAASLGISGAAALACGDCLTANLLFACCNPILISHFWSHGGRAQVVQFCIYEALALAGLVRQLGGIL